MLNELLVKEKTAIVNRWFNLVINTYPTDTQKFLATKSNPFSNPVRANLLAGLDGIYEALITNKLETPEVLEHLDTVIRIRAIQDFSPANALVFVFFLKNAVREFSAKKIHEYSVFEELLTLESRIDKLALLAFNVYMQCRERIFEVRIAEIKRQNSRLIERACQKYGLSEEMTD